MLKKGTFDCQLFTYVLYATEIVSAYRLIIEEENNFIF